MRFLSALICLGTTQALVHSAPRRSLACPPSRCRHVRAASSEPSSSTPSPGERPSPLERAGEGSNDGSDSVRLGRPFLKRALVAAGGGRRPKAMATIRQCRPGDMLDTVGDGRPDSVLLDLSGDGRADTLAIAPPSLVPAAGAAGGDGGAFRPGNTFRPGDTLDTVGDGRPDSVLLDLVGDGRADTLVPLDETLPGQVGRFGGGAASLSSLSLFGRASWVDQSGAAARQNTPLSSFGRALMAVE